MNQNNKINDLKQEIENLLKVSNISNINYQIPQGKSIDYYDAIVHIDSIKNINKGWKIEMNERGKNNIEKFKNEKIVKIGVIGEANKGKTFLLSKLSKMTLPYGTKPEGINIKYPLKESFRSRKIVLLDTAPIDSPILSPKENFDEKKKNEEIKDEYTEKKMTELFIQNYIAYNADIVIVVIGDLTVSGKKLLFKITKDYKRIKRGSVLHIIHNLKEYTSIQQVKEYINNILLKSATFTLEKGIIISNDINSPNIALLRKKKSWICLSIFHLIYANENSEAGNYYNKYTLDFIENSYLHLTNYKPYDLIESIKERFIKISEDILKISEKEEIITKESFDNLQHKIIKLKNEKEITFKRCFNEEIGFLLFNNNIFEPKYNIYQKENKIIIRLEVPGNCDINNEILFCDGYYIIRIRGEKRKDIEPEKIEDNLYNSRKFGKFLMEIPLSPSKYKFVNEGPKITWKKGVILLEYQLRN